MLIVEGRKFVLKPFDSEEAAWEAIKDFYSERACTLLQVGDTEEFIVGDELLYSLGLVSR